MPDSRLLAALHRSTADLIRGLESEGWSDADLAAPSYCAGWTRGHVLTHIARNAEGIAGTLEGAVRHEVVQRYPDGWDARDRAIDTGAGRPLAEQLDDVRDTAYRLDRALTAIDDVDGWDRPTEGGAEAHTWIWKRLREVEIHRVDLAGSYTAGSWPAELVGRQLAEALPDAGSRVSVPVRIEIEAAGSISGEFAGRMITLGDETSDHAGGHADAGGYTLVRGPDWAVLAWLLGRPEATFGRLTALPPLDSWR